MMARSQTFLPTFHDTPMATTFVVPSNHSYRFSRLFWFLAFGGYDLTRVRGSAAIYGDRPPSTLETIRVFLEAGRARRTQHNSSFNCLGALKHVLLMRIPDNKTPFQCSPPTMLRAIAGLPHRRTRFVLCILSIWLVYSFGQMLIVPDLSPLQHLPNPTMASHWPVLP